MNWDDPADRYELANRVSATEYDRLFQEHLAFTTLETINGHGIRPVHTRFGRLYQVLGTDKAFLTIEEARSYAQETP